MSYYNTRNVLLLLVIVVVSYVPRVACAAVYSGVTFTDITASALSRVVDTRTFGICFADYNGDGYEDIYIVNHLDPPALLRNNGDSTFKLETLTSGIKLNEDFHGCAWGDYDNDGDPDLYQTLGANAGQGVKANLLYQNNNGLFSDVASQAAVTDPTGRGRSAGWFDYNNDGLLDLFVVNSNRTDGPNRLYRNNGDLTFTDVSQAAGIADVTAESGLAFADFDMDGYMDILLTSANRVYLYKNMGDGTFTDVTADAGLPVIKNASGSAWGDYDNDGDPDLFITTTKGIGDGLYVDAQKIVFEMREKNGSDAVAFTTTGLNVTFDLYFRDDPAGPGRIFIGRNGSHPSSVPFTLGPSSGINTLGRPANVPKYYIKVYKIWQNRSGVWFIEGEGKTFGSSTLPKIFRGHITSDGSFDAYQAVNFEFKPYTARNYLFENMGDGTFVDVTVQAGLADNISSQSAVWADFDNDGDLDLFVVNNGDVLNAADSYFVNNGDKTFTNYAVEAGLGIVRKGNGESAAVADINNDGFMDIVLTNGLDLSSGPYVIYRNNGNNNNWIELRLQGVQSNRDAVGAKIYLSTASGGQYRELTGGSHLRSQNSKIVHFGLGSASTITTLRIVWPSGKVQVLNNIGVNQLITIYEGQ